MKTYIIIKLSDIDSRAIEVLGDSIYINKHEPDNRISIFRDIKGTGNDECVFTSCSTDIIVHEK